MMITKDRYELNIISRHPNFNKQTLAKYFVDNIDTIGVWGQEAFEIQVKNNTSQRVQVKLSLDGTDILSASPATIKVEGKMWVLEPFETMNLEAWPETTENGARFVFGKTLDSVAANTHGDLSHKGIIAAAFFVEGYVPPRKIYPQSLRRSVMRGMDFRTESFGNETKGSDRCLDLSLERMVEVDEDICESGPAVGAGEMIKQSILSAKPLFQPKFDRIISLRYLWWDHLKAKLENSELTKHASGFVDAPLPQKLANLGKTPRIERFNSI